MTYILWWDILIPIYLLMRRDKEKLRDIGFTRENLSYQIMIGVALGLVTSFALSGITTLVGQREFLFGASGSIGYIPSLSSFILNLLMTIATNAFVEEVIFRGYLFKKMLDIRESKWLAVVFTAILFGLMHLVNGIGILNIISTTVFGFIYGICRAKLKNSTVLSLTIAHRVHNVLNGAIIFGILDRVLVS
ncbi:MAG: CPBP family intramembrane metalloprotease [Oscillospiraceae bacterium]|nr:CPBP family intramembrane metalloprotease [Oscillospiraceae bacterium]